MAEDLELSTEGLGCRRLARKWQLVRKLRELRRELKRAGFKIIADRGKGDHELWRHDGSNVTVGLDGRDGDDAKHYQEREVAQAIRDSMGNDR